MKYLALSLVLVASYSFSEMDFLNQDTGIYPVSEELVKFEEENKVKLRSMAHLLSYGEVTELIEKRARRISSAFINAGYVVVFVYSGTHAFKNSCGIRFQVYSGERTSIITEFNKVTIGYLEATGCDNAIVSKVAGLANGS